MTQACQLKLKSSEPLSGLAADQLSHDDAHSCEPWPLDSYGFPAIRSHSTSGSVCMAMRPLLSSLLRMSSLYLHPSNEAQTVKRP